MCGHTEAMRTADHDEGGSQDLKMLMHGIFLGELKGNRRRGSSLKKSQVLNHPPMKEVASSWIIDSLSDKYALPLSLPWARWCRALGLARSLHHYY